MSEKKLMIKTLCKICRFGNTLTVQLYANTGNIFSLSLSKANNVSVRCFSSLKDPQREIEATVKPPFQVNSVQLKFFSSKLIDNE